MIKRKTLGDIIGEKYSLNHLDWVTIKAPRTIYEDAVVRVTLAYYSEGRSKGRFTISMPISLGEKEETEKEDTIETTLEKKEEHKERLLKALEESEEAVEVARVNLESFYRNNPEIAPPTWKQ